MTRPIQPIAAPAIKVPTPTELADYEASLPGSGNKLFDAALRDVETRDLERRTMLTISMADARHLRLHRQLSLLLGTILAFGGLALGGFAVSVGANLLGVAAVLAPISGLAGIFVWGYGRRRTP